MQTTQNILRPIRVLPQPTCFADLVFLLPLPPVASNDTRFVKGSGEKIVEAKR